MNFGEAIQAMKDGKRVCRKEWKTVWLAINNLEYGRPSFIYLGRDNDFDRHCPWTPSQEDMMAEDWEIKTKTVSNTKTDRDGLLYLSMLLFFFALEQNKNEC